ncbi:MAG: protein kinase [Planctomycetes bacterium]|nr:protein kinase [Planctomycetota bacterium]
MADFRICESCDTLLEENERECPVCGAVVGANSPQVFLEDSPVPAAPPTAPTEAPGPKTTGPWPAPASASARAEPARRGNTSAIRPSQKTRATRADGSAAAADGKKSRRIANYRLVRQLGRGAMGVVYLAQDEALGREVALKVLPPLASGDAKAAVRFEREAQAAAHLDHPGIVKVFGAGEYRGLRYYAMTYVAGITLREFIDRHDYTMDHAALLAYYIADALAYAHESGVIHRDIKPENILIREEDGMPVITDFGLARRADDVRLTATGATVGTPAYMSPEQVRGQQDLAALTDQFSLGSVMYELFTGRMAFPGEVMREVMEAILHQDPQPARRVRDEVPEELSIITEKAMRKAPADRYADMRALADDLHRWLEKDPILARPLTPVQRATRWATKRKKALAIIGASVAVSAVVIGLLWVRFSGATVEAQKRSDEAVALTEQAERRSAESAQRAQQNEQELRAEQERGRNAEVERKKKAEKEAEARRLLSRVAHVVEYNTNLAIVEETRPVVEKAVNVAPFLGEAHFLLGRLEHRTFNYTKAEAAYEAAFKLDPALFRARFYVGLLQFDLFRRDEAFQKAQEVFSRLASTKEAAATEYGLLARAYLALTNQDYPTARRVADEALAENNLLSETHYLLAALASYVMVGADGERLAVPGEQLDFAAAEERLNRCLDLEPVHLNARILRGILRRKRRDPAAALADFEEAARIAPRNSRPLFWRGVALYDAGDEAGAWRDFDAAIKAAPDRAARFFRFRGLLSIAKRDWTAALDDFDKSLELREADPDGARGSIDFAFRAMCHVELDHPKEADADWQRAFVGGAYTTTRSQLGAFVKMPLFSRTFLAPVLSASRLFELPPADKTNLRNLYRFKSLMPEEGGMRLIVKTRDVEDEEYLQLLLRLSDHQGSPVPAALEKLDGVSTSSASPRMFLGFIAWTNLVEQEKILEQRETLPNAPDYYTRAILRYLNGRNEGTRTDLEEYVKAFPSDPRGAYALATMLAAAGEVEGAFFMLGQARKLGHAAFPYLATDADFAVLKGDPRLAQFPTAAPPK